MKRSLTVLGAAGFVFATAGCSGESAPPDLGPSTFQVTINGVNGSPLPAQTKPLPPNDGLEAPESWDFTIQAVSPTGEPVTFDGYVRLSVVPGAVSTVTGPGAFGRNILLQGGKASGTVGVAAVYGPSRLWVEDLGYVPFKPDPTKPDRRAQCSDGKDNNGNGLIDFPAEPGCAYADDDTEDGGTFSAGSSPAVAYALPTVADVRGAEGQATPYAFDAIQVDTSAPENLVVTRVASDGFYVTDLGQPNKPNSVYSYTFSTPNGMRVCDKITYLAGTANDFFGFTELSFPSYQLTFPIAGQCAIDPSRCCQVPEPRILRPETIAWAQGQDNPSTAQILGAIQTLQFLESSLVRIRTNPRDAEPLWERTPGEVLLPEQVKVADYFGPDLVELVNANTFKFSANASNCDFNGNGQIDLTTNEALCESTCNLANGANAGGTCSEWTAYSARNEYNVVVGSGRAGLVKINTSAAPAFDPTANRGKILTAVTGTVRKFSGGKLNWTIETRCPDDLVCDLPGCTTSVPIPSSRACVNLRTSDDNDEGTD